MDFWMCLDPDFICNCMTVKHEQYILMIYPISKINVLFWHIVLWIADWITFHKFGITGKYLSQYICLLDNTREHLRDPISFFFFFWRGGTPPPPPPLQTTPERRMRRRALAFDQWLFSHKQLIFCVPPQKSKLRPCPGSTEMFPCRKYDFSSTK